MPARSQQGPLAVAVVGSPRAHGNTILLVDEVLGELGRHGFRCEKHLLGERRIAACLGHEDCADLPSCTLADDAAEVLERAYAADVLILATPVYYENVSAQMKAFIDRNVFRYAHDQWLRARAVGLVAVTAETGLQDALDALRRYVALSTDGEVAVLALGGYADTVGAAAADAELLAAARQLGADLADAACGA